MADENKSDIVMTDGVIQSRLRSPVVWLSVLSQILLIIGVFCPGYSDTVKIVGGAVVEIFTLFGILNNPTNESKF